MFKEKFSINFFHKDKNGKNNYKQIIINSQDGKNKSYLKHYRDYYRFFNTSILEQDNFLSWVKNNIIRLGGNYQWFTRILDEGYPLFSDGDETLLCSHFTREPPGWEWKPSMSEKDMKRHGYIDENENFYEDKYIKSSGQYRLTFKFFDLSYLRDIQYYTAEQRIFYRNGKMVFEIDEKYKQELKKNPDSRKNLGKTYDIVKKKIQNKIINEINEDNREKDCFIFYGKNGNKLFEIFQKEPSDEYRKILQKNIYGYFGLTRERDTINKESSLLKKDLQIFIKTISDNIQYDKKQKILNFLKILPEKLNESTIEILNGLYIEKRKKLCINLSEIYKEKENLTHYFFQNYVADLTDVPTISKVEEEEDKVFSTPKRKRKKKRITSKGKYIKNIVKGQIFFCTGFPSPFTPPTIIIRKFVMDRWIRINKNIDGFDMWILQSDYKNFLKGLLENNGVEKSLKCLKYVDEERLIKNAVNIIQKVVRRKLLTKTNIKKKKLFEYNEGNLIEDEEPVDDWDANFEEIMEQEDSFLLNDEEERKDREEKEKQKERDLKNNNKFLRIMEVIQSRKDNIKNASKLYNKLQLYKEPPRMTTSEKRYFPVWWILSFGLNFFKYKKGRVRGRGKKGFHEKGKYLTTGYFEFIRKENVDCLNSFTSLLEQIRDMKLVFRREDKLEKFDGHMTNKRFIKEKNKMKQQSNDDNKVAKRVEAADNLVNIESDAKLSIKKYNDVGMVSTTIQGSYADTIKILLKGRDIKIYENCYKFILERIKDIQNELNEEIEEDSEDINKNLEKIKEIKEKINARYT